MKSFGLFPRNKMKLQTTTNKTIEVLLVQIPNDINIQTCPFLSHSAIHSLHHTYRIKFSCIAQVSHMHTLFLSHRETQLIFIYTTFKFVLAVFFGRSLSLFRSSTLSVCVCLSVCLCGINCNVEVTTFQEELFVDTFYFSQNTVEKKWMKKSMACQSLRYQAKQKPKLWHGTKRLQLLIQFIFIYKCYLLLISPS